MPSLKCSRIPTQSRKNYFTFLFGFLFSKWFLTKFVGSLKLKRAFRLLFAHDLKYLGYLQTHWWRGEAIESVKNPVLYLILILPQSKRIFSAGHFDCKGEFPVIRLHKQPGSPGFQLTPWRSAMSPGCWDKNINAIIFPTFARMTLWQATQTFDKLCVKANWITGNQNRP